MRTNLQYISQGKNPEEHLLNIHEVLKAGGKWVQLRLKGYEINTIEEYTYKTQILCKKYKATFILNDHYQLAIKLGLDGVHVGLEDESIKNIRRLADSDFIIGGTANTFQDIVEHYKNGADYIGLGPFKYTITKKNLSPVLGIVGYNKIISNCIDQNINIPIVAIGGIEYEDFENLFHTKISGIAISGLLTNSQQKKEIINKAYRLFNTKESFSVS